MASTAASAGSADLEVAGCRLRCWRRGTGEPVLFVQGVGVHGDGWLPQIDELCSRHLCLWFDNRGIGDSQPRGAAITVERLAQDALAVLDANGVAAAHVVGHSLGGQVALQLALSDRARVRSLALLCTFADGRAPARGRRMLWLGLRSRLGTARMRRRAFLQIILPPAALRNTDRDALAERFAAHFGHDLATQPRCAMQQIGAFRRCDLTPRLPELAGLPTLVVAAADDVIAPPTIGRALATAIPGARYVELAAAGHGAPISHATSINSLLSTHFDTTVT